MRLAIDESKLQHFDGAQYPAVGCLKPFVSGVGWVSRNLTHVPQSPSWWSTFSGSLLEARPKDKELTKDVLQSLITNNL